MSVYEAVERNQKQALVALHHGNEAMLDVMKPFMSRTGAAVRLVRDFPYVDRLPAAREGVEQWFGFFGDVLKEEREFLLHVVDMLPDHVTTHRVVKQAPKAA